MTQPNGVDHRTPDGHPERPDRLRVLDQVFEKPRYALLERREARPGDLELARKVHSDRLVDELRDRRPVHGLAQMDPDTVLSPKSLEVAATGLGGALEALDLVMKRDVQNAFCAIRPPGHHAERDTAMGFCLINTVAIVAAVARETYGIERVAIVDFDVHHGNGTQDIFQSDPNVAYLSTHQMPLYPGTGAPGETGVGNIVNIPLAPYSDGSAVREAYRDKLLPELEKFAPELLLVSAGFDADFRDPLAQLNWTARDFAWITARLMDVAERHADGRLVSLLEGGYDLNGLSAGVAAHLAMLMEGVMGLET